MPSVRRPRVHHHDPSDPNHRFHSFMHSFVRSDRVKTTERVKTTSHDPHTHTPYKGLTPHKGVGSPARTKKGVGSPAVGII